jgi:hypothetical protein
MPLPSTMTPIATITLASSSSTVTFSNIPQTYTDLVIVSIASGNDGAICIRLNGDTGSNYSSTQVRGNGTTATSNRASNGTYIGGTSNFSVTAGALQTSIWNIQNYANTTTNKTILFRDGMASHITGATVGLWRSTSAITSISLSPEFGTQVFYIGSTFTLYGVKAA